MVWPDPETELPPARRAWRKSKYWSDVFRDLGKYVVTGGVAAPFLGIGGATVSIFLGIFAFLCGICLLYVGYKLDPAEPMDGGDRQ